MRKSFISLAFMLTGGFAIVFSQGSPSKEYMVKAAFLFNFAQFVEWPGSSFSDDDSPLIIGVFGSDPFGQRLDDIVKDEKVDGHPLLVKRFSAMDQVDDCHILFINAKKKEELNTMTQNAIQKSTLTVGESDDFIKEGGMIRFFIESGKIRMQINLEMARKANLRISSKLLGVADIVSSNP